MDELGIAGPGWADLGTGGGIPGLPLAVALPTVRVTLIESVGRKCDFLEAAVATAGLGGRAVVKHARSERLTAAGASARESFVGVLARAVGPLATVVELAAPLLAPGGVLLVSTSAGTAEREEARGEAAAAACGLAPRRVQSLTRSPLRQSVCVIYVKTDPVPAWLPRREGRARSHPLGAP